MPAHSEKKRFIKPLSSDSHVNHIIFRPRTFSAEAVIDWRPAMLALCPISGPQVLLRSRRAWKATVATGGLDDGAVGRMAEAARQLRVLRPIARGCRGLLTTSAIMAIGVL